MATKGFRGKACAYCRREGIASTADHVIARGAFLVRHRTNLPKVPACSSCNGEKSRLETEFLALVLTASSYEYGDEYRREFVQARLRKNRRIARIINNAKPKVIQRHGRFEQVVPINIDADMTTRLMDLITLGLYYHHAKEPLNVDYKSTARIFAPDHEAEYMDMIYREFPKDSPRVLSNLGDGTFIYEGIQNSQMPGFSVWRMMWHGGIPLAGENGPQGGALTWIASTTPRDLPT